MGPPLARVLEEAYYAQGAELLTSTSNATQQQICEQIFGVLRWGAAAILYIYYFQ
jgi:hypothetical protein